MTRRRSRRKLNPTTLLIITLSLILLNCVTITDLHLLEVPAYSGYPYVTLNDNQATFSQEDLTTEEFEKYSDLDSLGRCGVAYANVCINSMPTEERGMISEIKPSGWHTVKYDFIDRYYLYNRCHLIGYQLTGENANPLNLITGTRYFNVEGMLPFENLVAEYVRATRHHVLYRVTPIYDGGNLVARGVQIEAKSVEDAGMSLEFNVYCYNVQPGVQIDYATGESALVTDTSQKNAGILEKLFSWCKRKIEAISY